MASKVFANGMEVACKASSGKSICAFPDVCFTPPTAPPTPPGVPIPYPNTGMASDMTAGSKTVKICGKEVMLKNKSYFKQSTGDEAGSAPKKGVVTSVNRGKVYFNSWSMNVKFEGENVVRHLDLTTHNHASMPGNSPPWVFVASMSMGGGGAGQPIKECQDEVDKAEEACSGLSTREAQCADKDCSDAKKCSLVTYNQGKRDSNSTRVGCCDGEQPHHLVEAHCFYKRGDRGGALAVNVRGYSDKHAPCVCAKGPRDKAKHGQYHAFQQGLEAAYDAKNESWTYGEARDAGLKAHKAVNPQCSEVCTKAQLDAYHKGQCGADENTRLRTDPQAGTRSKGKLDAAQGSALQEAIFSIQGGGGLV